MRQNKRYSVDAYVTMTINTDKLYVYADSIEGDWTLQSIRNLDEDERKDFR